MTYRIYVYEFNTITETKFNIDGHSCRYYNMTENVFFFIPNLIGFARVVLAFMSFYFMPRDPWLTFVCYFLSCFLDALDGHAARFFEQSTKFGGVLDMVTDRCTTACMFMMLAVLYPSYVIVFQFLLALDIGSHWIHMYTSMASGGKSHKDNTHPFLKLYYSRPILFTLCAANDSFFCVLYMIHWEKGLIIYGDYGIWEAIAIICFPLMMFKQLTNIIQMIEASKKLASIDVAERARAAKNN